MIFKDYLLSYHLGHYIFMLSIYYQSIFQLNANYTELIAL